MSASVSNSKPTALAIPTKLLEYFVILGMGSLVLDVLWGVFSRYVIGEQSRWTEELAIYLMVWVSLLGAALTYGDKGHLGVDYFVGKLDQGAQQAAAYLADIIVFIFCAFALIGGGIKLVAETFAAEQISPALGVPVGAIYMAVPLSGIFFCLFAIEHLVARYRTKSD